MERREIKGEGEQVDIFKRDCRSKFFGLERDVIG
jgi:hypothetical protein